MVVLIYSVVMYNNLTDFWVANGPCGRTLFLRSLLWLSKNSAAFVCSRREVLKRLQREYRACDDELSCISSGSFCLKDAYQAQKGPSTQRLGRGRFEFALGRAMYDFQAVPCWPERA
jgi:hypothetical protein